MSKKPQYLTININDFSGGFDLTIKPDEMLPVTHETVLVAPNKKVQKQWQKLYPGIKVVLTGKFPLHTLPGDYPLAQRKIRP